MTTLEHYFENLLFQGEDIKGEPNKNALTKEQQDAVWTCYWYVVYVLFGSHERLDDFIRKEQSDADSN